MKFKIIPNEQTPKVSFGGILEDLLYDDYILMIKFLSFARNQDKCAGLSANQVESGTKKERKRIMKPFFAMKKGLLWELIIHPQICRYYGNGKQKKESCLTWIGQRMAVKRWDRIKVEYRNIKGDLIEEELEGFTAQVFQHEFDHLMGTEENMKFNHAELEC